MSNTIHDSLSDFMHKVEEWQSQVEGIPSEADMDELRKIYELTEVDIRFILNNESREDDDLEEQS